MTRLTRHFQVFSVLRYRDFRLFWSGLVAQITGQQMLMVTLGWLAYDMTGSPLTLGIVNLVQAVPRITLTFIGGLLADRVDQRNLITFSQTLAVSILVGLAVLTIGGWVQVWHLILAGFLAGLVQSLDEPSRQALLPHLLPDRSLLREAVPLNSMAWQINRTMAPSIAGFVIAWAGAGVSFLMSAAGAGLMAALIRLITVRQVRARPKGNVLAQLTEGARYSWRNVLFRHIILHACITSLFGMGYQFMLPVFQDVFSVGPIGLGLLYSVTGVGAIFGVLAVPSMLRGIRPGVLQLGGGAGFATFLVAFAATPWFLLALVSLFFVGFALRLYILGGEILLQTKVPDEIRGRVMALWGMLWNFMPLGGAMMNAAANFVGARWALGGAASVMLALTIYLAITSREMRTTTLDNGTPEQNAKVEPPDGPVASGQARRG